MTQADSVHSTPRRTAPKMKGKKKSKQKPVDTAKRSKRGLLGLARDGETALHFAGMLMFLHGKAETSFDWDKRPFFLKFHTEVRVEREAAFRELCGKIGVQADEYLGRARR